MSRGGVTISKEMAVAWKEKSYDAMRQAFIDRVFISVLAGAARENVSDYLLERAHNLAEEAWAYRERCRRETE